MSEETRYQAASALDLSGPAALPRALGYLADPSWRVRRAAVERIAALPDPVSAVPGLVELLVAGEGPGVRNAAAAALVALGAPAVPEVAARLGSGVAEVRSAAAEVLGEIRDRRAVAPLAARMADEDENVRNAAAEALGKIGGVAAVEALVAALGPGDRALRLAVLDALERLGTAPAVQRLGDLARDRMLRRPAYRLLGFSDDPAALPLIARGLGDAARSCREAALAAVGELRLRRPAGELPPVADAVREAVERTAAGWIEEAIASEDRTVAAGAVVVLGWLADAARAPALAAAAEREELRSLAFEALEALGPEAGPALAAALPGLGPEAKVGALAALVRLNDGQAFGALCGIAAAGEAGCLAAIEALGRLGDPRAAAPLIALLGGPDSEASASAGEALVAIGGRRERARREVADRCRAAAATPACLRLLGRLGDGDDLATARGALRSADPLVRTAAAAALDGLGARGHACGCIPELLGALDDPVAEVRAAAARALGAVADPRREPPAPLGDEARRALAAALHDEEPAVRAAAALSAGRIGLDDQVRTLAELAGSPGSPAEVAAAAVRALGELGAQDLEPLRRAAGHADSEVVKEAVGAAARAAAPEALELLVGVASSDPRWDVRSAAARALAARADPASLAALRRLAAAEEDPLVARGLGEALRAVEAAAGRKA